MSDDQGPDAGRGMTREERLAAKLRENLRRRKAQARAIAPLVDGLSKKPDGS